MGGADVERGDAPGGVDARLHWPRTRRGLAHLCALAAAVFVCYLQYGVLQERLYTRTYDGERWRFTFLLIELQCLANAAGAAACLSVHPPAKGRRGRHGPLDVACAAAKLSLWSTGAMLCSNAALRYVSYPVQCVGKATKAVAVMAAGVVLNRRRHSAGEYACVGCVTLGVVGFMLLGSTAAPAAEAGSEARGVALLAASLALDGLTGAASDECVARLRPSALELMLWQNAAGAAWVASALVLTGEGAEGGAWLYARLGATTVGTDVALFCASSAAGQLAVFALLSTFGSLVTAVVTTLRKFATVLASVVIFSHHPSTGQCASGLLVFAGLAAQAAAPPRPREGRKGRTGL